MNFLRIIDRRYNWGGNFPIIGHDLTLEVVTKRQRLRAFPPYRVDDLWSGGYSGNFLRSWREPQMSSFQP